jgi:hypothetical protein
VRARSFDKAANPLKGGNRGCHGLPAAGVHMRCQAKHATEQIHIYVDTNTGNVHGIDWKRSMATAQLVVLLRITRPWQLAQNGKHWQLASASTDETREI